MVKGPKGEEPPAIYENTHIITRRGVSSGTITIHTENIPESAMMDFQVEYHRFKDDFLKKHSKVFEGEYEEEPPDHPAVEEGSPVPVPDPAPPGNNEGKEATPPTPATEENKDNGAGKNRRNRPFHGEWSETEKEVVRKAKNKDDAVVAYRAMFPESERSDYAVRQRYDILTKLGGNGSNSPADELQEKSASNSTQGELETFGSPVPEDGITVGVKVRQVKGKERAYGVGTVQGVGVDNLRVKFISSTKVLPRDHFELVKVKEKAEGAVG